jgi:hypothetical protein
MVGTAYMRWNPQIAEPAHPSFEGPPRPLLPHISHPFVTRRVKRGTPPSRAEAS